MVTSTINVRFKIRHMWLLKAINVPLILLGLGPCVPQFCIGIELV
jgi:hypothetical protein